MQFVLPVDQGLPVNWVWQFTLLRSLFAAVILGLAVWRGMCDPDKPMSQSGDTSPSSSARRSNDLYAACTPLSSDGAAAVLAYARSLIDKNRRYPAVLQHLPLWNFVWTVRDVATDAKEGIVYAKEYKRRRELVLIASLYRALLARGDAAGMSLAAFKARMLDAHVRKAMPLERCRHPENAPPLLLAASTIQGPRGPLHLLERDKIGSVKHALDHITNFLPDSVRPAVTSFARRVHADEALRNGRPRLITLEPAKFAARIQEFVDRNMQDMAVARLYWDLEERGEMTGIDFDSFKARLLVAHHAGRLRLGQGNDQPRADMMFSSATLIQDGDVTWSVVRRANLRPPVPWGPPSPPIVRRLVLHAP